MGFLQLVASPKLCGEAAGKSFWGYKLIPEQLSYGLLNSLVLLLSEMQWKAAICILVT